MNTEESPTEPEDEVVEAEIAPAMSFRCVCGYDLPFSEGELKCPHCDRVISPESMGLEQTQTLVFTPHGPARASTKTPQPAGFEDGPQPGDRFGHFEIVEPLGAGGMGAVYVALDTALQRYVALKVIHTNAFGSSAGNRVDRLKQEAVAQARLNHPHVVTIYFVGEEDGHPFFAMELVAGNTLSDRREAGPMPFHDLVESAVHVTQALEHASHFDIVHGDIKPSNLLVDAEHRVKLSDFGLARLQSGKASSDGSISGTIDYLAPEVFRGEAPSFQSDMYALGATLYELTYGVRPFEKSGSTLNEKIEAAQHRELEFPPDAEKIPQAWTDLLKRLLAHEPQDRFDTYAELLKALGPLRASKQVPAGRVPRILAYGLDLLIACMMYGATSAPLIVASVLKPTGALALLTAGAAILSPLGLLGFALIELRLRKTPGRYLFQLQVVDDYGLRPRKGRMFLRHLLRMLFLWVTCLGSVVDALLFASVLGLFLVPAILASQLFLFIDAILVLFGPAGLSLHDLICKTKVVLDSSHPHSDTD